MSVLPFLVTILILPSIPSPEAEEHVTTWGGGGAIATWDCGQVLRILCIYLHIPHRLVALHVCSDSFINLHPNGEKIS